MDLRKITWNEWLKLNQWPYSESVGMSETGSLVSKITRRGCGGNAGHLHFSWQALEMKNASHSKPLLSIENVFH